MSEEIDSMSPHAMMHTFSGRQNPRWQLTFDQWSQLNQLIEKLPKITENKHGRYQFGGRLGYSGFSAHFPAVSSYPDIYYVAQSQQAVLSNPGGQIIYNDEQKLIEKWFKDSGSKHGIPDPEAI